MVRRVAKTVVVIGCLAGMLPALAAAQPLSYSFDGATQQQGWGESQDSGHTITSTGWLASDGGNPTGHLHATDTGSDAACPASPCLILYFVSPTISGGLAANYGGAAAFNLSSSVSPNSASELVIASTALQSLLSGVIPESSGIGYHHLSIGLTEGPAWSYCTASSCVPASQTQFKAVLAAADLVEINADVAPTDTGETYDLDNVALTDGVPAPAAKKKKCKKRKKAKRRASIARKKCKKKPKKRASVTSPRTENREF
jgi:hypothetical protein